MISTTRDFTAEFNASNNLQISVSNWDYVVVQFVTPGAAVTFKATNDAGEVQGVFDGNAKSAINWVDVMGVNLTTNATAISTNATSIFKFNVVGEFMQFASASNIGKLIIYFTKIS